MAANADAEQQLNGSALEDVDGELEDVDGELEDVDDDVDGDTKTAGISGYSPPTLGLAVSLVVVCAMVGLVGWLAYRAYDAVKAQEQREMFVAAGRQAALNLTTIRDTEIEADVARILDSATSTFHDDFEKRSKPFIDVVKQVQSKSEGTVTAAGLESQSGDHAEVLVAVSVKTSTAGAPAQQPRLWRMRIGVQKVGDQTKISDVEFVP